MTESYPNTQPESFSPREWAFVNEYLKTGHATNSAIKAGYSPRSAHVQANRMLKNDKIVAEISCRQQDLAQKANYDIRNALQEYDAVFTNALAEKNFRIALNAVDAKVRLCGLVIDPKDTQQPAGPVVQDSIYSLGSDDELYDLLKRKREAGHGIDIESIGHDVAGIPTKSQTSVTP